MSLKKTLICLLLVFVVLSLVGCSSNQSSDSETEGTADTPKEPIKIGAVLPLSGTTAFDGASAKSGAEVAVKYINANGGVLGGHPIELIVEDSATDPAQATSAAEKLISRDNVVALLGAFNSSSTGAIMPIAQRYEVPLVSAISTSPKLTEEGNKWFFRAVGTSQYFVKAFAERVINQLNVKNFAYIYENGDWGRNSVAEFSKTVTALGGKNLTEQVINSTDADLYTQLTAIKDSKPDAIYAVSNLANAVRIAQQAKELGIDVPIIGEGAWASGDFFEKAGAAAEGIYGIVEYLPEIDTPMNKIFVAEYQKEYNKLPDKYAACDFNAIMLLADAIDRAGEATPAKIREALAASNFEGLTGPMKFNEKGQAYGFEMYLSHNENSVAKLAGSATVSIE
jgi:branched-chain amino acid transport system substrate-binding protein